MLKISVGSTLSSPVDTADVTVLVFVRGAENLEFANPKEINQDSYHLYMQSEKQTIDKRDDGNVKQSVLQDRYLINFGESVILLCAVLQRAVLYEIIPAIEAQNNTTTHLNRVFTHRHTRFPGAPGYDSPSDTGATGVINTGASFGFRYAKMTPLGWITPMFVARRGAIQWHYQLDDNNNRVRMVRVARDPTLTVPDASAYHGFYSSPLVASASESRAYNKKYAYNSHSADNGGLAATDNIIAGALSVECPAESPARYYITKPGLSAAGYTEDSSNTEVYEVSFASVPTDEVLSGITLHKFVNAGTDYSLAYFLCAPQVTYCTTAGDAPV